MPSVVGYYRHPTIHEDSIVFVTEDDLWRVSADGGLAHRITANPGSVMFPLFSPDGSRIAFTSRDEGTLDIYVIDADGGSPRRLTWLGSNTHTASWSRDGQRIVFASDWGQPFRGYFHLHIVSADGGTPRPLNLGPARTVGLEPGGKGVVLGRNTGDPARWKRYRGGTAGTLWIDRSGEGSYVPLLRLAGNLANPMWIAGRVYFLSDHEGYGNLYSCTPTGRDLKRHTDREDYYVRFPSTDGRRIVYHAGADLYVFDPATGEERRVDVRIPSARPQRNRKFVSPTRYFESFALHPQGHSVVSVHRGGVYRMGLWEGAALKLSPQGVGRYRLAQWMPDGRRIVAVADAPGEESIAIFADSPNAKPRLVTGDFGRVIEMSPAPAGADRVALTNHRYELILIDLATGRSRKIARSPHDRIGGIAWSPDGRWLAYGFADSRRTSRIDLLDTQSGTITPATRPEFRDIRPAFDVEGRYLYFLSERVFDPVYDTQYFAMGFPKGVVPCLVTLRRDLPSPFSLGQAPLRPPGANGANGHHHTAAAASGKEGAGKADPEKARSAKVEIDLEGIQDRVVAFPVAEGRYARVLGAKGRVLFSSFPVEGSLDQSWLPGEPPAKGKIESYDFEAMKTETVTDRVSDFTVSADGKVLGLRSGNRVRVVTATQKVENKAGNDQPGRESGWIDLERIRVAVVPGDEWRQMFREAWRLQRDQFWNESMSGLDWSAVRDRYEPLTERVASRAEFSDLLWEMQGELGTSHCYEVGGDYRPEPTWTQGSLGADLALDDATGTWHIVRFPAGDTWDEKKGSPLLAPGLDLRVGDEILAVGGQDVGRDVSPYERLVHAAGQDVVLTVRSRGSAGRIVRSGRSARGAKGVAAADGVRTVTVKTLREEFSLRYRDWINRNRAYVSEKTGGRVGYLHIPDMGPFGFSEFHRYFRNEVDKEGLIVDVRWNGGGNVSQILLQTLLRRRIGYDANRWGKPESYPVDAPMGPMVALTNEYAGSDGDIFSHSFKLYGLGPLIGKRTWGGVVGIWPRHSLVDGTVTTQPEFAFWFEDVGWKVENYGTDPDIEVEIRPQDHAAGVDPQLDRGIAEVLKILKKSPPRVPALQDRPVVRPEPLPRIGASAPAGKRRSRR